VWEADGIVGSNVGQQQQTGEPLMTIFVKVPITLAVVGALLASAVTAASARTYRSWSGHYMGSAAGPYYSTRGYDAYAYSGSYSGNGGCTNDGDSLRSNYNAAC
jgi:hypothetical protein